MHIDSNIYTSLDFVPQGYFIVDKDFEVLYWNKSLEILTKVSRDEVISRSLDEFFPKFADPIYRKRIEPIFMGGPPVIFSGKLHSRLFTRNDSEPGFFFRVTISSLPLASSQHNALFSIEDRSEIYTQIDELVSIKEKVLHEIKEKEHIHKKLQNQHKEIEEAFLALSDKNNEIEYQKEQLQELNATKDKFFSILAHDLRSPFNSMIGIAAIMSQRTDIQTNQELNLYFELLSQSINQTYSLLENLLDWSRTQTGRIEYKPKTIPLKQVVSDNLELYKLKFNEKKIGFDIVIDNNILVTADPNMLNTVLRNLISNAIKFTPTEGKILISAAQSNIELLKNKKSDNRITISINDNGIGISEENKKKLFRIEENFTSLGTSNEKGTGLGLILCKEFVEMNGGKIWVESVLGKGTTFYFTLQKALV